ncbi:5-(carboxyamino)imidazole ribonucleotide synthase [Luteimicrobium sp. DT211]|uniref:5-(carboxyamino)imidazole ribonucleotide synthase n=1 Tax=Luteimicrobium sp. DT211 TaxID=3393412 RepID=UPI003CFACD74
MSAPVVAVVGGGQLARMMAPAAARLGVRLRVLVESPEGSAAQVVADAPVGTAADEAAVRALVAPPGGEAAAVLTFEHEHVPSALLTALEAEGVAVRPGPDALRHAQDKIVMRSRLTALGVPCPRWAPLAVDAAEGARELAAFLAEVGGEAVVKTSRGGYDGKGVRVVSAPDDAADWLAAAQDGGPQLLVEEKVPFRRELAALVARRPSGEVRAWPVVESVQRDGVCAEVTAPAPDLDPALEAQARDIATAVAEGLGVTGVLAVELFEVPGAAPGEPARVLVNELAMRPHNSGHWTIDGSVTSQFEQHLRAVLDLPLGDTGPVAPWTVMANVLGSERAELTDALPDVLADGDARVWLYGKDVRPGRKLGHVNVSGQDLAATRDRARAAVATLRGTTTGPDGDATPTTTTKERA